MSVTGDRPAIGEFEVDLDRLVELDYTNHRGERAVRRVQPLGLRFESTEWHPEPQWVLQAFDLDRRAERSFALQDVHSWNPAAVHVSR